MDKKYKKVLIFGCSFSSVFLNKIEYNVDNFFDVLDEGRLEYFREFISGIRKEYSNEEIRELLISNDENWIEEGEKVDVSGDDDSLWLGIKVDDFNVEKWLDDNGYYW